MHELKRRAYLEAIGVDSYISRGQLPGAAATRRLVIVPRSPAPRVDDSSPVVPASTAAVSNTAAAFREAADAVRDKLGATAPPSSEIASPVAAPTPAVEVSSFRIVSVNVGGFLWVEELSQPAVSRDQLQLIHAMAKALALEVGELDVNQFDWPIHNNSQLDLGPEAANAALGGFVQRRADGCQGLIILGSACRQKLDMVQLELGQCVSTVSTADMLRDPQLKKQAWLDLQAIARRP